MNIGIFEKEHFEGAYPMIRICDKPEHQLTIFVNQSTYERFEDLFGTDMNRYTWIVQEPQVSTRQFVKTIYKSCRKNNIELLFLNTVSNNFIFYAFLAKRLPFTKVIVTLHDANSFLHSSLSLNFRRSVRHIGKKLLSRYTYAYSTVAESVKNYLKTKMNVTKNIYCIPGAVYESRLQNIKNINRGEPLKIVIPGSIDKLRRNYEFVFSLLNKINEQHIHVHITFLGAGYGEYGKAILEKSKEYSAMHDNLSYYMDKIVFQDEFDRQLDDCHFIFIPSVINTVIADNIEETYGLTKSSGNIFDAIKHGKPMIIPAGLSINTDLESGVKKYNGLDDLVEFIQRILIHQQDYIELASNALNNSGEYTIEKCRQRINDLL